jgi:integrase
MASTVTELFKQYLARCEAEPSTVELKERAVGMFVKWFGDIRPEQATPAMADDYRRLLKKGRSNSAANAYIRVLRPFWRWAWYGGHMKSDPFCGCKEWPLEAASRVTFSAEELVRIVRLCDVRMRAVVGLGLCGLRRGEALNLTISEIDQTNWWIVLAAKKATAATWYWSIKNHRCRYVPLPEAIDLGDAVVPLRQDLKTLMGSLCKPQPYICLTDRTYSHNMNVIAAGRWNHSMAKSPIGNFARLWRQLQQRAGVSPIKRFHELRASFCTQMIGRVGPLDACRLMGHRDMKTTMVYDRSDEQARVKRAMQELATCYMRSRSDASVT